jgi:hypothetical protein
LTAIISIQQAEGPYWNVFLQDVSRSGSGSALDLLFFSDVSQQTINGGNRDTKEFFSYF